MADALTEVVRALIDAAFSTGGINDAQRNDLHGKLDAAENEAAAPAPEPETDEAPTTAPPATETSPYV